MNVLKNRALTLVTALVIAGAGCSGEKGPAGTAGSNGNNGGFIPAGQSVGGLQVAVKSAAVNADQTVSVVFTMKDDGGNPVDVAGKYSTNAPIIARFSLCQVNTAADGRVLPYTVLTKNATKSYTTTPVDPATLTLNPTAVAPAEYPSAAVTGTLVENGAGTGEYTYTFPTGGSFDGPGAGRYVGQKVVTASAPVKVDPKSSATYAVWIEATRQTNTTNTDDAKGFKAVNAEYDFVPSAAAAPVKREIVTADACNACHRGFRPEGSVAAAFHGGPRVVGPYCAVCHNVERKSTATKSDDVTPAADASIFVHRIHRSEYLQAANVFHGINEVTYPQDLRNCDACHKGAAQGVQAKKTANRAVCGSCHDSVVFDPANVGSLPACVNQVTGAMAKDASGNWLSCVHSGAANVDDTSCKGCHVEGGSGFIGDKHVPVSSGGIAGANAVPAGAAKITYDLKSVSRNASKQPVIVFKLQQSVDGAAPADVTFNACAAAGTKNAVSIQLMNNFTGSPTAYFAYAVPEDGITAPADFNVTTSVSVLTVCNDNGSPSASGTISGPDSSGYYTLTYTGLTGTGNVPVIIPDNAVMLTGGLGYGGGLTQTNVPGYASLTVPALSVSKVASSGAPITATNPTGAYTARRPIVDTALCNNCHAQLGVGPDFHGGLRNDGPTCSFCHNPNRTSSGWSANAKDFIHGLHAGTVANAKLPNGSLSTESGVRTTPFNWHATSKDAGFWDITFPGPLNNCEACHKAGTYDFSAPTSAAAIPNMLNSSVATGKYDGTDATKNYAFSPYVLADNSDYGSGFLTSDLLSKTDVLTAGTAGDGYEQTKPVLKVCSAASLCTCTATNTCSGILKSCSTSAPCQADATTLVVTPITAACAACHDSPAAKGHMVANGGLFYATRAAAKTAASQYAAESCLVCHGTGGVFPIADVHK